MENIFRRRILSVLVFVLVVIVVFAGCSGVKTNKNPKPMQGQGNIVVPEDNGIVAVYLAPKDNGVLTNSDLKAHPEILKVSDFESLTTLTNRYIIPIWIDKDAIDLLPKGWLNEPPQKFYPIIVVGCSDVLYVMRDRLGLPIFGPYVDWGKKIVGSGFSVWMITATSEGSISSTLKGYVGDIDISKILEESNALFKECFRTLKYTNTEYGFNFYLPLTWSNYKVIEDKWTGYKTGASGGEVTETGPMILIRNPQWAEKEPTQDIPIMIFTISEWNDLENEKFHIGAAPIGPTELGRNSKYVFALPARYNYAFPKGFEIVDEIMQSNPLEAF
ncbi:hypothetical protein [Caldisericum exile]|nr:hypothetical protein [Caldisericum exile]